MASCGEDCDESVLEEIELLEAIYVHELTVGKNGDRPSTISLCLHPSTADNVEEQYVCLTLHFNLPTTYPSTLPEISICNPRGLAEEHVHSLEQTLQQMAAQRQGDCMLYDLIEHAKESLTQGNVPHGQCVICLEPFYDGEAFTRTDCYHHFHSPCLLRYVQHCSEQRQLRKKDAQRHVDVDDMDKTFCPVCRVPITIDLQQLQHTPSQSEADLSYRPSPAIVALQKKMAALFQIQKEKGGIIDLEAEKNKYLIPASLLLPLPTQTNSESEDESAVIAQAETVDSHPGAKYPAEHRHTQHAQGRGGPRQHHRGRRQGDNRPRERHNRGQQQQHHRYKEDHSHSRMDGEQRKKEGRMGGELPRKGGETDGELPRKCDKTDEELPRKYDRTDGDLPRKGDRIGDKTDGEQPRKGDKTDGELKSGGQQSNNRIIDHPQKFDPKNALNQRNSAPIGGDKQHRNDRTGREQTKGDRTGREHTKGDRTGREHAMTDRTPAEQTKGDRTGREHAMTDRTPAEQTKGDRTGREHAMADRTPAEQTKGDRTGRELTKVDGTDGEQTNGDRTGGEQSQRVRTGDQQRKGDGRTGRGDRTDRRPLREYHGGRQHQRNHYRRDEGHQRKEQENSDHHTREQQVSTRDAHRRHADQKPDACHIVSDTKHENECAPSFRDSNRKESSGKHSAHDRHRLGRDDREKDTRTPRNNYQRIRRGGGHSDREADCRENKSSSASQKGTWHSQKSAESMSPRDEDFHSRKPQDNERRNNDRYKQPKREPKQDVEKQRQGFRQSNQRGREHHRDSRDSLKTLDQRNGESSSQTQHVACVAHSGRQPAVSVTDSDATSRKLGQEGKDKGAPRPPPGFLKMNPPPGFESKAPGPPPGFDDLR